MNSLRPLAVVLVLLFDGKPGHITQLEQSSDLLNWTPIYQFNGPAAFEFDTAMAGQMFWRGRFIPDADEDGIPDSDDIEPDRPNADEDADGDGWSNWTEYRAGSNPLAAEQVPVPSELSLEWVGQNIEPNARVAAVDQWDWPTASSMQPGGGNRMFTEDQGPWALLRVTGQPYANVWLVSCDVDDPTPATIDRDPANRIDRNGQAGDDNMGVPALRRGRFAATGAHWVAVTLDADGIGERWIETTSQPGDNIRVAASTSENALRDVQVVRPGFGWCGMDNEPDDPRVSFSPMLTIWRRLHIEYTFMEPIPDGDGDAERNHEYGRITAINGNTITLDRRLRDEANCFEGGIAYIEVVKDGGRMFAIPFPIVSNSNNLLFTDTITVTNPYPGMPLTNLPIGAQFWMWDDERGNPLSAPGRRPRHGLLTWSALADCYIEPTWMPDTAPVPFVRNMNASISSLVWARQFKTLPSTPDYWSAHFLVAFQPEALAEDSPLPLPGPSGDNDPATPTQTFNPGISDWHLNSGILYMEIMREQQYLPDDIEENTVFIHELGHQGGAQHTPASQLQGLMANGAPLIVWTAPGVRGPNTKFEPANIRRFRENSQF